MLLCLKQTKKPYSRAKFHTNKLSLPSKPTPTANLYVKPPLWPFSVERIFELDFVLFSFVEFHSFQTAKTGSLLINFKSAGRPQKITYNRGKSFKFFPSAALQYLKHSIVEPRQMQEKNTLMDQYQRPQDYCRQALQNKKLRCKKLFFARALFKMKKSQPKRQLNSYAESRVQEQAQGRMDGRIDYFNFENLEQ